MKRRASAPTAYSLNGQPARYCSSCGQIRSLEGGQTVPTANGSGRWKCALCLTHRSGRPFGRRAELAKR